MKTAHDKPPFNAPYGKAGSDRRTDFVALRQRLLEVIKTNEFNRKTKSEEDKEITAPISPVAVGPPSHAVC